MEKPMVEDLNIEQVGRVYSGKPGCMCGCLGKYYSINSEYPELDDPKMVKRVVNILNTNKDKVEMTVDGKGEPWIWFLDTRTLGPAPDRGYGKVQKNYGRYYCAWAPDRNK